MDKKKKKKLWTNLSVKSTRKVSLQLVQTLLNFSLLSPRNLKIIKELI